MIREIYRSMKTLLIWNFDLKMYDLNSIEEDKKNISL